MQRDERKFWTDMHEWYDMIWYDMIWYSLTAIGFTPSGSGRQTCREIGKKQLYTKEETIQETIQKNRIHKIENKHTKQENKHRKNVKRHKSNN